MAGIAAAIFMGAASEIAYRMGLFNSSLLLIDGSFFSGLLAKELGKDNTLQAYQSIYLPVQFLVPFM
ncbi:MAG: hypothetical protein MZV70_62140 [Desulfobacterales bacterium]|nr:hypothetical protein [Desulfobacterales bacterium]